MSNRARIKAKKPKVRRAGYQPPRTYTSFNIFTRDGQNLTVTSKRPMTIEEAQYNYNALSISGND
nr:hypothetical protein [Prevotella sp.]